MEEKELYYNLSDNADMSCVCISLTECNAIMEAYLSDFDPLNVGEVFFTISPVYMTKSEYNSLGDYQF